MRRSRAVLACCSVALYAFVACSSWPGVSKDGNSGNSPGGSAATLGTCTGTPLPCSALTGGDCSGNSGCMDLGTCSGTASVAGEACGAEITYQRCVAIAGCLWSPNCVGTPLGSCTGATEASCLLAQGCAFVPEGSGTGGTASTCATFAARCTSASSCDCGYACVMQCATCASVCAHPCQTNLDCVGAVGPAGEATPFCTGVTNPPTLQYPGVCDSSP